MVQLSAKPSKDENLRAIVKAIRKAEQGTRLMVFPEYSMGFPADGLTRAYVADIAERLDGEFVKEVAEISGAQGVDVVVPIYEKRGGRVYNTAAVMKDGRVIGSYSKIHLFDALGYKESGIFSRGSRAVLFDVDGLTFGIVICYDVRFPELVKAQALAGAEAVLVPSGWYKGPLKEEQWQTLLLARAHESTIYAVGVGNANGAFIGRSLVADPMGTKVLDLGVGDKTGYYMLDRDLVTETRRRLPLLAQSTPKAIACRRI